jgi:hypothetical protein
MKNLFVLMVLNRVMKTSFMIAIICLATISCDRINRSYMNASYFIYVTGDVDKTVQISYLGREILNTPTNDLPKGDDNVYTNYGNKNVYFTENVKLPFYKEVSYVSGGNVDEDVYLTVMSENDSTTRAIIFDVYTLLADSTCGIYAVWIPENAQGECAYCRELSKDSVMNYLKEIRYPCYLEFSNGETVKKIRLKDIWEH